MGFTSNLLQSNVEKRFSVIRYNNFETLKLLRHLKVANLKLKINNAYVKSLL